MKEKTTSDGDSRAAIYGQSLFDQLRDAFSEHKLKIRCEQENTVYAIANQLAKVDPEVMDLSSVLKNSGYVECMMHIYLILSNEHPYASLKSNLSKEALTIYNTFMGIEPAGDQTA